MTREEKKLRVATLTSLILEEFPAAHAEVFLARLHNQLPQEHEDLTQVLNEVHVNLRVIAAYQEGHLENLLKLT